MWIGWIGTNRQLPWICSWKHCEVHGVFLQGDGSGFPKVPASSAACTQLSLLRMTASVPFQGEAHNHCLPAVSRVGWISHQVRGQMLPDAHQDQNYVLRIHQKAGLCLGSHLQLPCQILRLCRSALSFRTRTLSHKRHDVTAPLTRRLPQWCQFSHLNLSMGIRHTLLSRRLSRLTLRRPLHPSLYLQSRARQTIRDSLLR
mmetsp:Transcript_1386/g.3749  ORF Transcript_1386/g.3749 Transcript_1386/m.3749 type:complete len:201 (-) Transcript_1386:425-1027(-)